jgi:hypothetical protein
MSVEIARFLEVFPVKHFITMIVRKNEYTKGLTRSRILKKGRQYNGQNRQYNDQNRQYNDQNRQYNGQNGKVKKTNNDVQNITQKTNDRVTPIPLKTGV